MPFLVKSPLRRFLRAALSDHPKRSISREIIRRLGQKLRYAFGFRPKCHSRSHSRPEIQATISVLMPVYEAPEWVLREAIDSIRQQLYPYWELCIADDMSMAPQVEDVLNQVAAEDARIRWVRRDHNGNISAASNSALALASGGIRRLDGSRRPSSATRALRGRGRAQQESTLDIIYSDEDQIDGKGRRSQPYFKTDWNIDLLLGHNMISHLGVYRRKLVERVGGFREGFEGSQDYDLALRCADASIPERILHIPCVLYHWRRDYGAASFSEGTTS